jgi:hypothetical protein
LQDLDLKGKRSIQQALVAVRAGVYVDVGDGRHP